MCGFMCVFVYCGRLVNRDFVVLFGSDEVIEVHFEEMVGKEMMRAKRRRNGGG